MNPYLPAWEYIPDGEPRVFGDRVYIYGSHDSAGSDKFCDFRLKVWSAPIDNLNDWVCHGDSFHTRADSEHMADTDWTDRQLFAPDVVEKDGKYYLYAYIVGSVGCVAVSDKPEGPFKLVSQYTIPENPPEALKYRQFIDPGVLVDDDGRVYIYCGFLSSYMAELDANDMHTVIDGSFIPDIIPVDEPHSFFEACSPRKINGRYYLIYSPKRSSTLVYAVSDKPTGPFKYGGVIVDSGDNYPGGNNHGSIVCINGQYYIFYHRMTNGTIMSRRGCVERIEILPDGTIPQVEATSLGFEKSLSPYKITPADAACVLTGGCLITEKNIFSRAVTAIKDGCVLGYKYFDFGEDYSSKTCTFNAHINGLGHCGKLTVCVDGTEPENEIGSCDIGLDSGIVSAQVKNVTGVHSVFLKFDAVCGGDFVKMFDGRHICELIEFVFTK